MLSAHTPVLAATVVRGLQGFGLGARLHMLQMRCHYVGAVGRLA